MSLPVIYCLALPPIQNPDNTYALNHVQYAYQIPIAAFSIVDAPSRAVAYNIANMQSSKIDVALLPVYTFFGMEVWNKRNMEENFSMK